MYLDLYVFYTVVMHGRKNWPKQREMFFFTPIGTPADRCSYMLVKSGLVFEVCVWENSPILVVAKRMELRGEIAIENWIQSMRYMIDAYEW
jgi:nickel-dependent lactate racemase